MKRIYYLSFILIFITTNLIAANLNTQIDVRKLNLPKSIVLPEPKEINLPKNLSSTPDYVIFDNFVQGDKNHEGTVISNLFELCYYDIYQKWPNEDYNYASFMLRTQYSDAFFAKYKITDFDVAIFPLGEYPLNVTTQGGIKVIDKIKEMLDAGKRVMVVGRRMLLWAFVNIPELQLGKDPVVIDFLTKTLGMKKDSSGTMQVTVSSGGTKSWIPFHLSSDPNNPTTKGYDIYCNVAYGRNVQPTHPIIYQDLIDVFQVNNVEGVYPSTWLDSLMVINQQGKLQAFFRFNKGQRYVGLSARIGDGKFSMWTIGPDVAGGSEITYFHHFQQYSVDWFTADLPKPVPYLELETSSIDFGETLPESEKFKELRFRNFGKKNLIIKKIYLDEWTEPGIFTLLDLPKLPLTLEPEQMSSIRVKFRPNAEGTFEDNIIFEFDAGYNGTRSVSLRGIGGKDAPTGPEITVQKEPFDFGVVDIGTSVIKPVSFESSGTAPLIISKIEFLTNDGGVFSFPKPMSYPIVVPAGKIYNLDIKYSPRDFGTTYKATLKITSDAKKNPVATLQMIGRTPAATEGPNITASIDTLKFPNVKPLHTYIQKFDIINTGKQTLKINLIYFSYNDDEAFSLPDKIINGTPISIDPNNKLEIPVSFKPFVDGMEYTADLGFFTNATNPGGDDFHVYFVGMGDNNGLSVRENELAKYISISAFPNPSSENIRLSINSTLSSKQIRIVLSNSLGQTVEKIFEGYLADGNNEFHITQNLNSGLYYITITDGTNSLTHPILIVK